MKLNPDHGLAGILEPVFAIRTEDDLGIGDTDGVRQMIDWCHKHGFNIFQTLPINETSEGNSPYDAISSLAIDPATLAVSPRFIPDLPGKSSAGSPGQAFSAELRRGNVNYTKVKALKRALLEAAFESFVSRHFNRGTARAAHFRQFIADNAEWLADYALFRVLMEENGGKPALGTLAAPAPDSRRGARGLADFVARKTAREIGAQTAFFQLRAMAGVRANGRRLKVTAKTNMSG